MNHTTLFHGLDLSPTPAVGERDMFSAPRVRRPERAQVVMDARCLDELVAEDHDVRPIWEVTGRLDLSAFYADIAARGSVPGREATDPRLLVALWLYAAVEGIGSGRHLAEQCQVSAPYRWLCGGVSVNYHLLNDFRVEHEAALDDLFTEVLAALMSKDVVRVRCVSQDGTRVRASAGAHSFRRRGKLEEYLVKARAHVEELKKQGDHGAEESLRRRAAREQAARSRVARMEAALAELSRIEQARAKQEPRKTSKRGEPRASTTDPEARKMKMSNGGFNPAYNVQIATDVESRAIVAIDVTSHGCDTGEDVALREQIRRRTGCVPSQHLLDGGYISRDNIEQASREGVAVYMPLSPTAGGGKVCTEKKSDPPGVAAWRERMTTEEGQSVYRRRSSTSETVNADLKCHRGLGPFRVRGIRKVRCVALWSALAYNLMHFAAVLLS